MAEIRRPPGVSEFSSVFILPILTLPSSSPASFSIVGASIRQGPHHGAQKSTITGTDESRTSDFQLASVNSSTFAAISRLAPQSKVQGRTGLNALRACPDGSFLSPERVAASSLGRQPQGEKRPCLQAPKGRHPTPLRDAAPSGLDGF